MLKFIGEDRPTVRCSINEEVEEKLPLRLLGFEEDEDDMEERAEFGVLESEWKPSTAAVEARGGNAIESVDMRSASGVTSMHFSSSASFGCVGMTRA
jgi:hypothetical protein